jgi:hypothetical protein
MAKHESTDTISKDVQLSMHESVLQNLLTASCKLELNLKARMLSLLNTDPPHIVAQQQFTKNEWCILLTLLTSYPHYAPYETLLASLTLLSPTDCRKRLQEAKQSGSKAMKRELKPVHRALSGVRVKLGNLSSHLKISLVRDLGYSLTTSSE